MNIGENKYLFEHPQYLQAREVVDQIKEQNLLSLGAGYCWGMCDLVWQRLADRGIKSRIVECELTISCSDPPTFAVIGANGKPGHPNEVFTHTVIVTEHERPLLIDTSIAHYLPQPFAWVCAISDTTNNQLANAVRGNWTLTYRPKLNPKYPALHQANIIERINLDQEIRRSIDFNKKLAFAAIAIIVVGLLITLYNWILISTNTNRILEDRTRIEKIEANDRRQDQGIEKILRDLNQMAEKKK